MTAGVRAGGRVPAAGVVGVLAGLHVALFLWYLDASVIVQPFADLYSMIRRYLELSAGSTGWWTYLWEPHDIHRPVLFRLLLALDIEAFAGVAYPFIVTTLAFQAALAGLVWRESRAGVEGAAGAIVGGLAVMLTLNSVAAATTAVPLMNAYTHVMVLAALALGVFDGGDGAATSPRRRAAGLALACLVPFMHTEGFVVWPILLWVAWRSGLDRRWLGGITALGAVLLAVYLRGLPLGSLGPSAVEGGGLGELTRRLDYLLAYLGLPLTRSAALAVPGRILGAALLLAGMAAVLRGVLAVPASRLARLATAFIMLALLPAVAAAAVRVDEPVVGGVLVPVRYTVLLAPLHVGLLWLAAPAVRRWLERARPAVAAWAVGAVCLALLGLQVGVGQAAVTNAAGIRATIARFEAGEEDAEMTVVISEDLAAARRELELMRRAGVYQDRGGVAP